jgi:hypothetical protein
MEVDGEQGEEVAEIIAAHSEASAFDTSEAAV